MKCRRINLKIYATKANGKTVARTVEARAHKGLAYHKDASGKYVVTHVRTGYAVLRNVLKPHKAMEWLHQRAQGAGVKWTWAQSTLRKRGANDLVRDAVKMQARGLW